MTKKKDRRHDLISEVTDTYRRFESCAEVADREEEIITFILLLILRLEAIGDKWLDWLKEEESEV